MSLEIQRGEQCASCGCGEHEIVKRRERFNRLYEWLSCTHCGEMWTRKVDENGEISAETRELADLHSAIPYARQHCPRCNSTNGFVYATRLPLRYHRCRDCGYRFKTFEENRSKK